MKKWITEVWYDLLRLIAAVLEMTGAYKVAHSVVSDTGISFGTSRILPAAGVDEHLFKVGIMFMIIGYSVRIFAICIRVIPFKVLLSGIKNIQKRVQQGLELPPSKHDR